MENSVLCHQYTSNSIRYFHLAQNLKNLCTDNTSHSVTRADGRHSFSFMMLSWGCLLVEQV
uniref:Uncharacterized protein n=1 Tax=Kalanchoe fedtschenkoi TaxID=63787 RepID=A0A7N0V0B1_KALFE